MVTVCEVKPAFAGIAGAVLYSGLSEDSIRRKIRSGELTPYRPFAGKVLIDLRQLDELIRKSADQPTTRGRHMQQATGGEGTQGTGCEGV